MSAVGLPSNLLLFGHLRCSSPSLQLSPTTNSHRISCALGARLPLPLSLSSLFFSTRFRTTHYSISALPDSTKTETDQSENGDEYEVADGDEDEYEQEGDEEEYEQEGDEGEYEEEDGDEEDEKFKNYPEKDWSFLETDRRCSQMEWRNRTERIISAGGINPNSRVLVSIGSIDFVDRMVESRPSQFTVVVHQSFSVLSQIKDKHDDLRCWLGELPLVPWDPFDCIFVCCLPALPLKLHLLFPSLVRLCSEGAKVIISSGHGRKGMEEQRMKHPDVILSTLPTQEDLKKLSAPHSFLLTDFVDEPYFYLALFTFNKPTLPS